LAAALAALLGCRKRAGRAPNQITVANQNLDTGIVVVDSSIARELGGDHKAADFTVRTCDAPGASTSA
jgi:hypothetical protein